MYLQGDGRGAGQCLSHCIRYFQRRALGDNGGVTVATHPKRPRWRAAGAAAHHWPASMRCCLPMRLILVYLTWRAPASRSSCLQWAILLQVLIGLPRTTATRPASGCCRGQLRGPGHAARFCMILHAILGRNPAGERAGTAPQCPPNVSHRALPNKQVYMAVTPPSPCWPGSPRACCSSSARH